MLFEYQGMHNTSELAKKIMKIIKHKSIRVENKMNQSS